MSQNNISVSRKSTFNVSDYIRNIFQIDHFFASFKEIILPRSLLTIKFIFVPYKTFCASSRNRPSICNRRPVIKSTRVAQGRASSAEYFLLILTRRRKSKYFRIIHNPDAFGTGIMEVRGIKGFRRGSVDPFSPLKYSSSLLPQSLIVWKVAWKRSKMISSTRNRRHYTRICHRSTETLKTIKFVFKQSRFFFIVVSFLRCFSSWKIVQQEWSLIQ